MKVLEMMDVSVEGVHVRVEGANEVLEDEDTEHEEDHLDVVSKTHGLEPDSVAKLMRSDTVNQVSFVVEPVLFFKVLHVLVFTEFQNVVGSRVLHDRAADVDLALPVVLDDPVGGLCLHRSVQVQFGEEVDGSEALNIWLFEKLSDFIRVIYI